MARRGPDRDFVKEETGNLMFVAMQLIPVDLAAAIGAGAKGVVEKAKSKSRTASSSLPVTLSPVKTALR